MPAIGTFDFSFDDGLDSGIAMLLAKPPGEEICLAHSNFQLNASPNTPYVVYRFAGATSYTEAYDKGSQRVQEVLDALSITGRAELITCDAEDEHLVWWATGGRYAIALVSTATFQMKVGPAQDAQGNPIPGTSVIPKHHLGFRFYRLSQASDDLFDAYRNMYLAFESLMSSRYPKLNGGERAWLRQSLTSASCDLALSNLVSATEPDTVTYILSIIYDDARLPLFHAKDGKDYFAPAHSSAQRETVTRALAMLTDIVLRMADKWFSVRRMGGWINPEILEEQNRRRFDDTCFVFSDNPVFTLQDGLYSESISKGKSFPAKFIEHFRTEVRHHVYGELAVFDLAQRGRLHALYLINTTSPLMGFSLDTTVDFTGFDDLQVILFVQGRNASMPKYMYSR